MSSHLVLWEVHQVLFNSKISCERTDFAGEMLVKCIISTSVCQIPRTNIRNTGRALQFSFQWWAINMCHYFWRGVHGFDTAVANCLPKRGLFFNFHDFCLLKNSSFLKIDTLSEKDPWIWEACLQKVLDIFPVLSSSSNNSLLLSPGHFSSTIRSTNTIPKSQAKRRKSEERVSREWEKEPKFMGESEEILQTSWTSWSKGYKVEDLESLNTLYFRVFCSIDKQCEHFFG